MVNFLKSCEPAFSSLIDFAEQSLETFDRYQAMPEIRLPAGVLLTVLGFHTSVQNVNRVIKGQPLKSVRNEMILNMSTTIVGLYFITTSYFTLINDKSHCPDPIKNCYIF